MASNERPMADKRPSDAIMLRAAEWRVLLYSGDATEHDWSRFMDWMDQSPDHASAYDIVSESEAAFIDYVEANAVGENDNSITSWRWQPLAIAASVVFLIVSTIVWGPGALSPTPDTVRYASLAGELREVELGAGLTAKLNGETELIQIGDRPHEFELLNGEVLFSVGPQFESGIVVRVGSLSVADQGTIFNISRGSLFDRIAVSEGAVEIRIAEEIHRLESGQRATFVRAKNLLQIAEVDPDGVGEWFEGRLEYTGEGVDELLLDASRYIGSPIRPGDCQAGSQFVGTIQFSGNAEDDVNLLANLLGCSVEHGPDGWTLVQ